MHLYISTIIDSNQGNRLQNYALQYILKSLFPTAKVKTLNSWSNPLIKFGVTALYRLLPNRRLSCFKRFNKNHISFSFLDKKRCKLLDRNDAIFIIGSDQVWNPSFSITSEFDYLPNIPKSKKMSYAASFGISEINSILKSRAHLLADISQISVRENDGVSLVHQLTGKKAQLVLDPTLLLTKADWSNIAIRPHFAIPKQYVFKYVLGSDTNNKAINDFAIKNELEIVDANQPTLPIGPSEFIWLIQHAKSVITDSYHASIFSLIFQKQFVVLKRKGVSSDMSSRFSTLFTSLNLMDHYIANEKWDLELPEIKDWENIFSQLNSLKRQSIQWLRTSIDSLSTIDN